MRFRGASSVTGSASRLCIRSLSAIVYENFGKAMTGVVPRLFSFKSGASNASTIGGPSR